MLSLYNTINRKKEAFKPLKGKVVKMYSCGPTVYDFTHIGNFKSYCVWDMLIRYLKFLGYKVIVAKNITDVGHLTEDEIDEGEDKFEKAARREKKSPREIAKFYTKIFFQEEKDLNILPPDFRPKATGEIAMIQKIIKTLLKKGFAYQSFDGVYFDVSKFKSYGKLSGNSPEKILAGARVEINPNKRNSADFALWKKRIGENKNHSLFWKSPWGDGFPGWHIECSAMAMRYLGKTLDIHTGGRDNMFPHHESEIAQSEAANGKTFSRFWLHSGLIDVDGKKMSKSLKNFYRIKDIKERGFHPLVFRFWVLTAHYRSPMNFSWKSLEEARKTWQKFSDFRNGTWDEIMKLSKKKNPPKETEEKMKIINKIIGFHEFKDKIIKWTEKQEKKLLSVMNEDLNTPKVIAILQEILKEAKRRDFELGALLIIEKWDQVLAILPAYKKTTKKAIPAKIKLLAQRRQEARGKKDFKKADQLRKEIEKNGYEIVDKEKGYGLLVKN